MAGVKHVPYMFDVNIFFPLYFFFIFLIPTIFKKISWLHKAPNSQFKI